MTGVDDTITDEMVHRALDAWFASPPSETDQGLARSMRAALVAGLANRAATPAVCGACGQPWTGEPCGQKDNGHPFPTCYPAASTSPSEDHHRRCTICGFIVDTSFAAEKPTAEYTMQGRTKRGGSSPVNRACTCHPDDKPPRPCPKKYAYSECVAAHEEMVEAGADAIVDQILTEYLAPENVHEAKRRIARAVLVAADRLSSG